jgi:predicted dehydrogenase
MTGQKLRVGITGTGLRGRSWAVALRGEPRTELVAVHDPDQGARKQFAQEYGVERDCATYDELLGYVDLVILVSPMPYHAPQACAALARNVHVLSEVPAVVSHEQSQDLLAAVRRSDARYGMAENFAYRLPNLIVRELVRAGELGSLYYGEADHVADLKGRHTNADGTPKWTRHWWVGRDGNTYPTHSLGPLLQWFGDRITSVSCVGSGRHEVPEQELQDMTVLLARTVRGALLTLRFSWSATRPWLADRYAVQGTNGVYDAGDPLRGVQPAVHIRGETPPLGWQPLESLMDRFLPARHRQGATPPLYPVDDPFQSQFPPADQRLLEDFVDAVLEDRPFDFDIYAALDITLPGLLAEGSIAQGGAWVHVPNPRFFTAGIGTEPGREAPLA